MVLHPDPGDDGEVRKYDPSVLDLRLTPGKGSPDSGPRESVIHSGFDGLHPVPTRARPVGEVGLGPLFVCVDPPRPGPLPSLSLPRHSLFLFTARFPPTFLLTLTPSSIFLFPLPLSTSPSPPSLSLFTPPPLSTLCHRHSPLPLQSPFFPVASPFLTSFLHYHCSPLITPLSSFSPSFYLCPSSSVPFLTTPHPLALHSPPDPLVSLSVRVDESREVPPVLPQNKVQEGNELGFQILG